MDEDTGLNPAACKKRREFDSLSIRHGSEALLTMHRICNPDNSV